MKDIFGGGANWIDIKEKCTCGRGKHYIEVEETVEGRGIVRGSSACTCIGGRSIYAVGFGVRKVDLKGDWVFSNIELDPVLSPRPKHKPLQNFYREGSEEG